MARGIDSSVGFLSQSLLLHEKRAEVLANNISNQDTPGFRAKDIDFRSALSSIKSSDNFGKTVPLEGSHSSHFSVKPDAAIDNVKFRTVTQPSIDGNTVDGQIEQAEFAENTLRYLASLRFLDGRIQGLMFAIKGTR